MKKTKFLNKIIEEVTNIKKTKDSICSLEWKSIENYPEISTTVDGTERVKCGDAKVIIIQIFTNFAREFSIPYWLAKRILVKGNKAFFKQIMKHYVNYFDPTVYEFKKMMEMFLIPQKESSFSSLLKEFLKYSYEDKIRIKNTIVKIIKDESENELVEE